MTKVLYTTPVLQHPPICGPHISVENAIKALGSISELHIISRVSKKNFGGSIAQKLYEKYSKVFLLAPSVDNLSKNKYINKIQLKWIDFLNKDAKFIINYCEEHSIKIIWCDRGLELSFRLICTLKKLRPDIMIVNDTCAVYSEFILRGAKYENDITKKTKIIDRGRKKQGEEKKLVQVADVTTVVSEFDAKYFRSISDDNAKIKQFSNVIDIDLYKEKIPCEIKKPYIYFAGWFGKDSPTDHGIRWFIDNVFEYIKQEVPGVTLCIAGRGSLETLSDIKDDNIEVIGERPSLYSYLSNSDVVITPLWFESGTRFKILEAGAASKPVVSTILGAEGIKITNEKDILISDEPKEFAKYVIKVLIDLEYGKQLGGNLNKLIKNKYCVDYLSKEASEVINYLKGKK